MIKTIIPKTEEAKMVVNVIRDWARETSDGNDLDRIKNWLKKTDNDEPVEPIIDIMNWVGQNPNLRTLGLKILEELGKMRLIDIVKLAGRRMVFPLALSVAPRLADTNMRENILGGIERKYKTMLTTFQKIMSDIALCTFIDLSAIAEPFGCKVEIPEDAVPMIVEAPIKTKEDLRKIYNFDPSKATRLVEGFAITKLFADNFTFIKAGVSACPFTMAGLLMGAEDIARKTIKEPDLVKEVINWCVEMIVMDANTHIQSGADLVFVGDPTAGLLSPRAYKTFAADYLKKVVERIKKPIILHICGNTNHIIEMMCDTGVQGISVDYLVDLPGIVSRVPKDVVIMGNINPVGCLLNGSPDSVKEETKGLLEKMREVPNYLVMSGCDIPYYTPCENILAMVETAKGYSY